jgi:preprotein translocase subunit SecG
MGTVISLIIIVSSILLILIIMIQNPKGGGLSTGFSGANQIGGVRRTTDFLEKATWGFAIAIVVLSMVTAAVGPSVTTVKTDTNPTVDVPAGVNVPTNNITPTPQ